MLCNITQNAMGQTARGGTLPGQARGTLPGGTLLGGTQVGYPQPGQDRGTLLGGTQVGYPPASSGWGVPCWGRGGYPGRLPPSQVRMGGVPCWGGTQIGQQKEYSLHGRRYASCVYTEDFLVSVCQSTGGGTPVPGSFPCLWSQVLSYGGTSVPTVGYPSYTPPAATGVSPAIK